MKGFVNRTYFCHRCLKGYNTKDSHSQCDGVKLTCYECKTYSCNARGSDYLDKKEWKKCKDCNRCLKTSLCFEMHKTKKTCEKFWECPKCNMFISKNKLPVDAKGERQQHQCSDKWCETCAKYVQHDHNCCIQKIEYPVYKTPMSYIFYDFECTQATGIHEPNLVVARWSCSNCLDSIAKINNLQDEEEQTFQKIVHEKQKIDTCKICLSREDEREKIFAGEQCTEAFCKWLFSRKDSTAIAHNNSGYDIYFILKYMLENGIAPTNVIRSGGKIRQLIEHTIHRFFKFLAHGSVKIAQSFWI